MPAQTADPCVRSCPLFAQLSIEPESNIPLNIKAKNVRPIIAVLFFIRLYNKSYLDRISILIFATLDFQLRQYFASPTLSMTNSAMSEV